MIKSTKLRPADIWILNKLNETIKEVTESYNNEFNLHQIVKTLRVFYYTNFFDFYLESTKPLLKSNDHELLELTWNVLRICNKNSLLMYHPFMPSITEEIWQLNSGFSDADEKFTSILDFNYQTCLKLNELNVSFISLNLTV